MTEQSPIRDRLRSIFAIDARSLALLRILVATVLFINLLATFNLIEIFYSEGGVLPQSLNRQSGSSSSWTLLWLSDSDNLVWICVLANLASCVALLVGFKTFFATLICLVLTWSLQMRNPLILTGGDVLLRMLLFWGLFVPWGSWWSFDSTRFVDPRPAKWQVSTAGTAGLMIQLASVYFFSGLAKWNGSWDQAALTKTLNLEMYIRPLGSWLGNFVEIHQVLAPAVMWIEIVGPILIFLPFVNQFARGWMMAIMWLMHLGIWLTMSIGIFSAVAMMSWCIFIPGNVWNGLLGTPESYDEDQIEELHELKFGWQFVALAFIGVISWINIDRIDSQITPLVDRVANLTMTQQEFRMFGDPPMSSPWPQYPAVLENGYEADIFQTREIEQPKRPDSVFNYMKSQAWRRYHFNLIAQVDPNSTDPTDLLYNKLRRQLFQYQVKVWNANHPREEHIKVGQLVMNFDQFDEDGKPNGEMSREIWADLQ